MSPASSDPQYRDTDSCAAAWRVVVVVLNWNGRDDTLKCVESLRASRWPRLQIVVIDNGSSDGTERALRQQQPGVTVLQNGRNLGFAGGNNVGIEWALSHDAEAVFVLNNDTEVPPDAIGDLVSVLCAHPQVAACSPVLHYAHDPDRLWFAGSAYDPRRGRSGRSSAYERGKIALPDHPVVVDRAVGAAMLMRREALLELGAFRDELFFLHEDVDWSLRARAAGWQILLEPTVRIAHKVAASQGGNPYTPITAYYGTRNDLEMGRRHGSRPGLRAIARQVTCLGVHLAQLRRARRGTRLRCLGSTLAGWADYRRAAFGPRGRGGRRIAVARRRGAT